MLDLDHFKAYNDCFGHLAGDDALRQVAGAMSSCVTRPADACCRIGGEEFAIILAPSDEAGATTVAWRVREAILRCRIRHDPRVQEILTVSIGYALASPDLENAVKTLHDRADRALYRAKASGRDRIVKFQDGRDLRAV